MQLGNLVPRFRSTIISLYCGAYDSSAFVLVFVKVRQVAFFSMFCLTKSVGRYSALQLCYDAGVEVRYVFFAIAAFFSIVILSTFWFIPKHRIPFPLPEGYNLNFSCRFIVPVPSPV